MTILQAAIIAFVYWLSQSKIWYGSSILRMPIVIAPIMGLIFGNMPDALIIGATLQMIYIGSIAPGGNPPADEGLAATIAIPVALITGMAPEIAVTLALPLGILGVVVENIRKTANTAFIHKADEYALEGNVKGIKRVATLYPALLAFPMRFLPVFIAGIYGPEAIQSFINVMPEWIVHGLTVAGGLLPALGIAITINVIGRKSYLPLFVIGFFAITLFDLNILAIAILSLSAIAFVFLNSKEEAV